MQQLLAFTRKEFQILALKPVSWILVFLLPLIFIWMMQAVFGSSTTSVVSIYAVDEDKSSKSEQVMDALRKGHVALLILAEDISGESAAKFLALAGKTGVESFRFSLKERLGSPLGKDIRSVVAVAPGSFADSLRRELTRYGNFFEGGVQSR